MYLVNAQLGHPEKRGKKTNIFNHTVVYDQEQTVHVTLLILYSFAILIIFL